AIRTKNRGQPPSSAGKKLARYVGRREQLAENEVMRATKTSHPTRKPVPGPKAAVAYKYGPPVPSNRLPTSAKHNASNEMQTAQSRKEKMLYGPASSNARDGRAKMPAPITPLITTPTRSQRRIERSNPGVFGFSILKKKPHAGQAWS